MYNTNVFKYSDLNSEERDRIYQLFHDAYVKSTGTSWNKSKFESRAHNWLFLGNNDGFITLRPQSGGLYKFTGTAGSIKGVMTGLEKLKSMNIPVWGMMTDKLAHILEMKYGFVRPNKFIIKTLLNFIPKSVFGNTDFNVNNDGSITLHYSDVGNATKFFVANKQYYRFLLKNIIPQLPNVPKIVILGIKKIIGVNETIEINSIVNEELKNILNEKRSNPEKNIDIGIRDFLLNLLSKYDISNIFVSFRTNTHVTDINPNNRYDTPTGFYAYPLYAYLTKEDINDEHFNITEFRNLFPYQGDLEYIHFFILKNKNNIIYNDTDKSELKKYVQKIYELYGHINPVKGLCEDYLNDKYVSTYTNNFLNNAHTLWLFIYSVIPYIMDNNSKNKVTAITNLCRRIGIDGFVDDKSSGYIHSNEKNQAIFFKVKGIGEMFVFKEPKINKYNLHDKSNLGGITNVRKISDNLYLFITKKGVEIPLDKDYKPIFKNARVRDITILDNGILKVNINGKYNYLNSDGKLISPNLWFDDVYDFKNGLAGVQKDNQWNSINTEGKILSPNMWFDDITSIMNGFVGVEKNGMWNYLDMNGNILSPNMWFDEVDNFENGFGKVKKDNKFNFINTEGKILSPNMWFDNVHSFHNGFAKVLKDNQWNLINTNGKLLSPMWFDGMFGFQNGLAKVLKDDKRNLINTEGKLLSPMWFDDIFGFLNGFAKVQKKDGKWNFINTEGKILSPNLWFDVVGNFENGFAVIKKDNKRNFVNIEGKILSPNLWFDEVDNFENGFGKVKKDDKFNFINTEGKLLSPNLWFDVVYNFENGFAKVVKNNEYNFINTEGKLLSPMWFDDVYDFKNGLVIVLKDDKKNLINTEGKLLSQMWFDGMFSFQNGFAIVLKDDKRNFINTEGKIISPNLWFDDADNFNYDGLAKVLKDNQWNLINTNGKILSPNMWFDDVFGFEGGFVKVKKDGKYNFINTNGKLLSPMWFDDVYDFKNDGFAKVKKDNNYYNIDKNGNLFDEEKNPININNINEIINEELRNLLKQ